MGAGFGMGGMLVATGRRKAVFWRDALLQDDRGGTVVCVWVEASTEMSGCY